MTHPDHAGLRALTRIDDGIVVASWGRATAVAIRWLAARRGLDAHLPLGELRAQVEDDAEPASASAPVIRLAVDPYRWMVETFVASLRTPAMRHALGLGDEYSFRQFLTALARVRAERDDLPPWASIQAAAPETHTDRLQVIDIDDPAALAALGPHIPHVERRRTTTLDQVVTDHPFIATPDRFVAPRSVCFYDDDAVHAVDQLSAYEFDRLGFARRTADAAGGPPNRPAPARPGRADLVPPQASVGEVQRAKRQLLTRGYEHLTNELRTPGTRPLVFRHHDLILLISGRAASTFAVRWFLHHNDMADDSTIWPHEHRTRSVYPSDWHKQRVRDVVRHEPLVPLLRIARDPYRRAVSAYLHSLYQVRPRRPLAQALDIDLDQGYSFDTYLRALVDLVPQGRCDPHAYLQFHPIEYLGARPLVHRVEDGAAQLRALETELGLTPTSDEEQAAMRATSHQTPYAASPATDAAHHVFPTTLTPDDPVPPPPAFFDQGTVALVDAIYASDFDRLGYPRRPLGEAGS